MDEFDANAVDLLDLGGEAFDSGDEAFAIEANIRVEPAAQFALLAAGEGGDAAGVGFALDECECLEDGVVDAGGELLALLGADAGGALGIAFAGEPPEPGEDDDEDANNDGAGGEERADARRRRLPWTKTMNQTISTSP